MTDYFALFGESPRPWIDPEALKEKYRALTLGHHPDVAGATGDFAEINRAYQTLSDPVARLRHLLDLDAPAAVSRAQPVPADVAAYFTPVAEARQAVDTFFKKRETASSPIAQAMLSGDQYAAQERLEETIAALQQKQDTLLAQLREADALWLTDRPAATAMLPVLWQSLGYTAKWLATLRESLFRLASL